MSIDVNKLVRVYLKMKDAHTQMLHDFQEKETELKGQMDQVKQALLEYCKEHNTESVKTESGLFYRTVSKKYWTSDWDSMYRFIKEHDVPELLERRVSQTTFKEFLQANPDKLPEGMNVDSRYAITVTRAR